MKKTGTNSDTNTEERRWNTPVYNALKSYSSSGAIPFHMPGHKMGSGIPDEFLNEIEKLDITEIPGADDLHRPEGILKQAQELAAAAFGARRSYFVVNGSTGGLHAAIAAVCKPGQRLITGRDSHSSVINGMLMAGALPYYILPEYVPSFQISSGVRPYEVEKALKAAPDAAGVLITRPNYYGICCDIRKISEIVHSYNKVLIVDEAHGPHLAFNKRLPVCSLEAGADICVQSAHKTLPAFTQGAYLHVGSDRIDIDRLEYFLDIYQTTSPSYILMAFLDIARELMQKYGAALLDRLIDSINENKKCFAGRGITLLDKTDVPGFEHDITRLTVNVARLGITGYDAEKLLRQRYNIQAEMSDLTNLVFICTAADSPERIGMLFSVLDKLQKDIACGLCAQDRLTDAGTGSGGELLRWLDEMADRRTELSGRSAEPGGKVADPRYIMNAETERVKLEDAAGRISKCTISPYPPGIALVCPGETISEEAVKYLLDVIKAGGKVHGTAGDGSVAVLAGE